MIRSILCAASLLVLSVPFSITAQEDAFSLEGLVVTASPTPASADAIAAHVTVMEGAALRLRGLTTVTEALRATMGTDVVRNGSFGAATSVFVRGAESDHVLVLIDGVQMNQPGGAFDFSALSLDNVERIEVLRGPSSALYGSDAVSGVIHIITRTGQGAPVGSVATRVGSFGRRDWSAALRGGTNRSAYSVSISRDATDGILAFNNRHSNSTLSASGRFSPDDRTRADISLRVGDRQYHFPTDGAGNEVDRNAFTYGDQALVSLGVTRSVTARLDLQARFGVSDMNGGSDDRPDGPADTLGFFGFTSLDYFRRRTADVRAHWKLDNGVVTAGWETDEERTRSFTESLSQYGTSTGKSRNARINRGYYLHLRATKGTVAYNLGGRLEDNESFGTFVTWQAGLSWIVSEAAGTRLRASAGSALKEPTFFENFATGFALGNPALKPEQSQSWEVGLDQDLASGRARLRVTWFSQSLEDLIQYTFTPPAPGDPNYFNVAAAHVRGLEVGVTGDFGPVEGAFAWTWLDANVVDAGFQTGPGATFVEGEALLRRPAHRANGRLSLPLMDRGMVFGDFVASGARSDRDFGTFPATPVDLPRYLVVSVGARWTVTDAKGGQPGLEVSVRAENLLDEQYEEVLAFRAPGRGLYVGGRVTLGGRR